MYDIIWLRYFVFGRIAYKLRNCFHQRDIANNSKNFYREIYLSNLLHGLIVVCFHFYKKGILCSQMSVAHTALDVEHVRIQ